MIDPTDPALSTPLSSRSSSSLPMALSGLGAQSMGIWTRRRALELLTPDELRARLVQGIWQKPLPGVYADAGYELDAHQWAFAAVLASGGEGQPVPYGEPLGQGVRGRRLRAVAMGRTAARCWGFPLIDDQDPSMGAHERFLHDVGVWRHLTPVRQARQGRADRGHELRRHQSHFKQGELVQLSNGLWLTSPMRTLVDCALLLTHEALVCAVDHALNRKRVTASELAAAALARSGSVGAPALASAVEVSDPGAESAGETLARLILKPALPRLRTQVQVRDRSGRVMARLDLGEEDLKLAIESDGKLAHAGTIMVAKDRKRDRRIEEYGWWTERATWFELRRQPAELRERILARAATLTAHAA